VWLDPTSPGSPLASVDNLRLDEEDQAAAELAAAGDGFLVVECTTVGMTPRKDGLARIAEQVGPHVGVVAGAGWYVARSVPELAAAPVETLVDQLLAEIAGGEAGVPSGVIGEIGTSAPLAECEVRFLQAAAQAQRRTGLAVQVHLDGAGREGPRVLEVLDDAGASLDRVSLSHVDDVLDVAYCRELLSSGCYVELDAFGASWTIPGQHVATDDERLDLVEALCAAGHERRVLLAQDVWLRQSWTAYGGNGYGHLGRTVVPALAARGLDADVLTRRNPLAWLTGSEE
jgi:phosphotriesterase-related protein